ncbi:MAG: hypothetical protein EBT68_03260 [Verrucomicrobia bacterium]|nr:hypothetical protein [Verrucomicrobiota bacterium]NBR63492.1 hypothetical protein [Verrucomicrobiota bacterium]
MPKRIKYKRGYTWRHFFDEWWDRRPEEWKVKLFVSIGLLVLAGLFAGVFMGFHWIERKEMVGQAENQKNRASIDSGDAGPSGEKGRLEPPGASLRQSDGPKIRESE